MWPTIPLVVTQATVGTAMGLTTSLQMIGVGISNLIVGQILSKKDDNSTAADTLKELERWKYIMIYLLANVLACMATAIFLNIVDKRRGGLLNISRKQKQQLLQEHEHDQLIKGVPELHGDSEGEESDPLLPGRRYNVN